MTKDNSGSLDFENATDAVKYLMDKVDSKTHGWYGIKDKCCNDKNIRFVYTKDGLGQCQVCKRIFKRLEEPMAK